MRVTNTPEQQARYDEKRKEIEEKNEKERLERLAKMKQIERGIAPLKFKAHPDNATPHQRDGMWRIIVTPEGERVGSVNFRHVGYSWNKKDRFRVESNRIPSRKTYYASGSGYRDYQRIDSVIKAITKFCFAVSDDESRASVLRTEVRRYKDARQKSYWRSLTTDGEGYGNSAKVDGFINLLASDITQDRLEGEEFIRVLIRKKRVHKRFAAWLNETFINPRQEELKALDTSKERVRT
jgi:hypothetical protein